MGNVVSLFDRGARDVAAQNVAAQDAAASAAPASAGALLDGVSLEVMPRTAAKIDDFRAILPPQTRVYIAHIDGTPFEDMLATARRLTAEGATVMPHFPARVIADVAELERWIAAYAEIGVREALALAGGVAKPRGALHCSMQLLETGLFDRYGFRRVHVAGHPEGNRDIDPDGSDANVMEALRWKQAFAERTDAEMAIVTQFAFEADPVIAWAKRLRAEGVDLPIHLGVAGPAKLQTLIKFAIACGVGPSLRVLKRRAMDMTKLLTPFEPTELLQDLAAAKAADPEWPIEALHLFPLGGIKTALSWAAAQRAGSAEAAATA